DGAAAVVLTSERASVRVAGIGQGTDSLALRHRTAPTSFRATQSAAAAAFAMAGFGPDRVDVAEIHDAFAPFELISLEDTGLFPQGKAGPAPRADPPRLRPVRADLARGHRTLSAGQGRPGHARRPDRAGRTAADQYLRRPQGARPPAGGHRARTDPRGRLAGG